MARTDTLGHFLTDVADAIREKTGSSDTITASDFDTEIENIPSGIDLSEYFNSTVTYDASQSYRNIFSFIAKKIPFDVTISSETTTLSFLFEYCDTLRAVPKIICGDNITNMTALYYGNTMYLTLNEPIDTSGLNTTNVTNMASMFRNVRGLPTVNVSGFNTSKVTNMNHMFNSTQFTSLDLSSFTSTSLTSTSNMFAYSTSLMHLDIRNMDLTTITTTTNMFGGAQSSRIPASCEIIVADQTQKSWLASNFSWLSNVKTVEEYEAE